MGRGCDIMLSMTTQCNELYVVPDVTSSPKGSKLALAQAQMSNHGGGSAL